MANTKGGLGAKGLNALFNDNEANVRVDIDGDVQAQEIDISLIDRNPNQPRKTFDEDSLREMATSIATFPPPTTTTSARWGWPLSATAYSWTMRLGCTPQYAVR